MYKVVYLPQARRELEEAVMYIASELYAPDSAAALLDEIDHAVQQLKEMPYRHGLYPSLYALKNEVRFFPIKNYNVFYIVDETRQTVEIRHILYQRRNSTTL